MMQHKDLIDSLSRSLDLTPSQADELKSWLEDYLPYATDSEVEQARKMYEKGAGPDYVQIDDDTLVSRGDEGVWVTA